MIRAIRWVWLVLPPGWCVALFLLFYLAVETLCLWFRYHLGLDEAMAGVWRMRDIVVGQACFLYGAFRVVGFHPLFRPEYRRWLESTPWTRQRPLPVGPVHLVVQDAVVLAVVLALLHTGGVVLLQVLVAFAFAYHLAAAVSLWPTGLRWRCYAILFVLGAVILVVQKPVAAVALLAAIYPFTHLSLSRSLEQFPWQLPEWWPRFELKPNATRDGRKPGQQILGWPYDLLQPLKPSAGIGLFDGTAVSLLLGWWAYAGLTNVPNDQQHDRAGLAMVMLVMTLLAGILGRFLLYCATYWWPISLWGRLWTGRWIIPRYDRVFVAPLLALAVPIAVAWAVGPTRFTQPMETALTISLVVCIVLNVGPRLTDWRLTGGHRINPGVRDRSQFVRL